MTRAVLALQGNDTDKNGAGIFVEEDTCNDKEQWHVKESVSFLALQGGQGPLLATKWCRKGNCNG